MELRDSHKPARTLPSRLHSRRTLPSRNRITKRFRPGLQRITLIDILRTQPPISFVFLGSLLTGIGVCVYFLARRYSRRISKRPRSASPVRYRNTYRNPNPRA